MEQLDPRDRWEYYRVKANALAGKPWHKPGRNADLASAVIRFQPRKTSGVHTLGDILAQHGKLSSDHAVRIALGICEELSRFHHAGLIHGDLQPPNIIVEPDGQITVAEETPALGSVAYISPEQVRGRITDARSDVYALGVMLYEMLTGHLPFQAPDVLSAMNSRLANHPVPPRVADARISSSLQEVVYRAMEREPRRRYASVGELAWDLTHLEHVQPVDRAELHRWGDLYSPWLPTVRDVLVALTPVAAVAAAFWCYARWG
jgi:serine/threonine-protein kinase